MREGTGNFAFLSEQSPQLAKLGQLAERYFADDPPTALVKLRGLRPGILESGAGLGDKLLHIRPDEFDRLNFRNERRSPDD